MRMPRVLADGWTLHGPDRSGRRPGSSRPLAGAALAVDDADAGPAFLRLPERRGRLRATPEVG